MYVFEDRITASGFLYATLHEMTDAQLAEAERKADPDHKYVRTAWERAHRWVLADGQHTTALYVDDMGKVRRAK